RSAKNHRGVRYTIQFRSATFSFVLRSIFHQQPKRRELHFMTFHRVPFLFLPAFFPFIAFAQSLYMVSGVVLDASTNKPLPAATIRVAGPSNKGTITNERGQFQLSLPSGESLLIISYLGYRSDTVSASALNNHDLRVVLQPEAIKMSKVIITDEDPAYEIIRRAIESKPKWMGALKTFQCEA